MSRKYRAFSQKPRGMTVPADLANFGVIDPPPPPGPPFLWTLRVESDEPLTDAELRPVEKLPDGTMRTAGGHVWHPFQ